jgi:GTPase SAR1 family protein
MEEGAARDGVGRDEARDEGKGSREREIVPDLEVTVHLWDRAGEECYRSVTPSLACGANALLPVYDSTQSSTFNDLIVSPKYSATQFV